MDTTTLIGILGAATILIFFGLNQINILTVKDVRYDLGNAIGSTILIIFAYLTNSLPFIILNLVWAAVSWKDVATYFIRRRK